MKTGIFFRVKRGDKWSAIDLVDMTQKEQLDVLKEMDASALRNAAYVLLRTMKGEYYE